MVELDGVSSSVAFALLQAYSGRANIAIGGRGFGCVACVDGKLLIALLALGTFLRVRWFAGM